MEYANIINITRFCTDDGPGIRTTVFLKGCPLRCAWCHNPESQNAQPEILYDRKRCIHCGACAKACPVHAHSISGGQHSFDRARCTGCGRCAAACPSGALELSGRRASTEEVFQEIEKDAVFYKVSGGGVTVSGGEPLHQPAFTAALFKQCKAAGFHTAMETSGFASRDALAQALPHCDLVLFDIKETDPVRHREFIGVPLQPILENLRTIDAAGIPTVLRLPLIPGWNDREDHLLAVRALAGSLRHCAGVQAMPYHRIGAYKYDLLQRPYRCADVCEPAAEAVTGWRRQLE